MKKKVLLQIDSCLGILSTGRIVESIGTLAQDQGWECYAVHSARFVGKSQLNAIQIGSKWAEYIHYAKSLIFDNHGLNSKVETKRLVETIRKIKPDVIQLHCIHGYYLNYEVLFKYIKSTKTPVVWTFHDCWAFTGHCAHFVTINCNKWKSCCYECDLKKEYPASFVIDNSKYNYNLKKELFANCPNLTIVPVSVWMEDFVKQSFFGGRTNVCIHTIHNGTDINRFRILEKDYITKIKQKYKILERKKVVMGCSSIWNKDKGLNDFYKLSENLPEGIQIILVGLNAKQIKHIPKGIIGIQHTDSIEELAALYNIADVFVNPTYADTFPTVNIEAMACGTPVITYRTGGSPEAIDSKTGFVCDQGNVHELVNACVNLIEHSFEMQSACRSRAEEYFNRDKCFQQYIDIYESVLNDNNK